MSEFPNNPIADLIAEIANFWSEAAFLNLARDVNLIYNQFLQLEEGFNGTKLAFLDKGIKNSPYQSEVEKYPERLTRSPKLEVVAAQSYPNIGERPEIDEQGLEFLHPDIKQACICLGGTKGGPFTAQWLGRNALDRGEFWSTTKIIPILNVVCALNAEIQACEVRGDDKQYSLIDLIEDVITYDEKVGSSNAIVAMLKRFQTYAGLEEWLKRITGTPHTIFRGIYGEEPFICDPQIVGEDRVLLEAAPETDKGENQMTAYDLTRIISMVGWHQHLSDSAKLPGLSSENWQPVTVALGKDPARFIDVAIEKLGLKNSISELAILSKLGFGHTSWRQRTELTYTCFLQFLYKGKCQSIAMTLRAARSLGDFDREAVEVDARMATEVTEILRRLVTGELLTPPFFW